MEPVKVCSNYHSDLFSEFDKKHRLIALEKIARSLKFDGFVCRGLSGVIPASILAYRMNKRLLVVRKEAEKTASHAYSLLEGWLVENYVILDDFIAQGDTMRAIIMNISKAHEEIKLSPPVFKAILLYKIASCTKGYTVNFNDIPIIGV